MRIQPGTSLDQESSQLREAFIKDPDAAGPVVAPGVDIRAGAEQYVYSLAIGSLDGRDKGLHAGSVVGHWIVEVSAELRVVMKYSGSSGRVARAYCRGQHFRRSEHAVQGFDVFFQPGPTRKSVFVSDDVLGVGEFETRARRAHVLRPKSISRGSVALLHAA